jgi:biotin carboxylase
MSEFDEAKNRDMVLFTGSYLDVQKTAIKRLEKLLEKQIIPCVILDIADASAKNNVAVDNKAVVIYADFSSTQKLQKALAPYKERFLAVTCRAEKNIPLFKKVIPHVPYINTPSELSLDWTTDKVKMRQLLRNYDKSISPKFTVVHDANKETLDRIERTVGFPLMIKPSGLAASLLVTICYHREELESNLKNTVRKINRIYKERKGRGEPQILVEEFMEGVMYSIDAYVNQRGVIYYTPLVHVKTGRAVGYEDFFGYMRITPVTLKAHKIEDAKHAAEKAIEAVGMRSTTCHIELMKTEDGWKVIELGPRVGGFRHEMYELSYGIDHSLNDILIRIPKKPIIAKKAKGYTSVMQFYARKKGKLTSIDGIIKVRKLESFKRIDVIKKVDDICDFARNGDSPVFTIVLFNQNRSRLLADVRRLEQAIKINVTVPHRTVAKTT